MNLYFKYCVQRIIIFISFFIIFGPTPDGQKLLILLFNEKSDEKKHSSIMSKILFI